MIITYILATILDVHSSCLSINKGNNEILLPFKTCKSISISQVVSSSIVTGFHFNIKNNHKKLDRFILISGITIHSLAAYHNYKISK